MTPGTVGRLLRADAVRLACAVAVVVQAGLGLAPALPSPLTTWTAYRDWTRALLVRLPPPGDVHLDLTRLDPRSPGQLAAARALAFRAMVELWPRRLRAGPEPALVLDDRMLLSTAATAPAAELRARGFRWVVRLRPEGGGVVYEIEDLGE